MNSWLEMYVSEGAVCEGVLFSNLKREHLNGKSVTGSNIHVIEVWIVNSFWIVFLKLHDISASQLSTRKTTRDQVDF